MSYFWAAVTILCVVAIVAAAVWTFVVAPIWVPWHAERRAGER